MKNNRLDNPLNFKQPSQKIPDRSAFRFRHPKLFVGLLSGGALFVLFSKPLYDIFLNDVTFDIEQLKKEHKSRFAR